MKKVALRFAAGLGVTIAVAAVIVGGIRLFSDGPVEILPGGPMPYETIMLGLQKAMAS